MSERAAAVAVVGAGLAGLVTATALLEHGIDTIVLEAADEPGGTTALSSGWVWRYRDMKTFQRCAPGGDRALQEAVWTELPDALVWLDQHGAKFVATGTDNPLTDGVRIDPPQVVDALTRRLPEGVLQYGRKVVGARRGDEDQVVLSVQRHRPPPADDEVHDVDFGAVVFCGGGYGGDLARIAREAGVGQQADAWALRNAGTSDGSSMDAAMALDALRVPVNGESYARAMPVGIDLWPDDFVRFSQVYGQHAALLGDDGALYERADHDWADAQLLWNLARTAGGGWYLLDRTALGQQTPYGTVQRAVREAETAGAIVLEGRPGDMPELLDGVEARLGPAARERAGMAVCAVAIRPGITHTVCGLRVDAHARTVTQGRLRVRANSRVLAAGVEAGGVATGGYASGLAQGLALGRIAARTLANDK